MKLKILSLLLISSLFTLQGCDSAKKTETSTTEQKNTTATESNVVETALYQVVAKEYPVNFQYTATIQGGKSVEVRSRTEGMISKINFSENSIVKAGQLLVELDDRSAKIALEQAQASLAQEQARLENARKNFENLKSFSLEQEEKSQKELEDAIVYQQLAESAVKSAMARVKEAELDLDFTRIQSPISGVTGKVLKSEGAIIDRGDSIITTITQLDPVKAIVMLSQQQMTNYKQQIDAKNLILPESNVYDAEISVDGKTYESVTKFEFPEQVVPNEQNQIKITLNLNNSKNVFKPKQSIGIKLKGAKYASALIIPTKAIVNNITDKFVYVFNSTTQKPEKRTIEVIEQNGETSILSKGLTIGERIIIDHVDKIKDNTLLKIKS